jgi:hypothetical protein
MAVEVASVVVGRTLDQTLEAAELATLDTPEVAALEAAVELAAVDDTALVVEFREDSRTLHTEPSPRFLIL